MFSTCLLKGRPLQKSWELIDNMAIGGILLLVTILLAPPVILVGGIFAFLKMKRQVNLLVRVGEKEFKWFKPKIYGNIISTTIDGKHVKWQIDKHTKPEVLHTSVGLVPFYFVEIGRALTSEVASSSKTTITEENLSDLEDQSILKQLFKMDMMGAEGIMMLVGAAAVGFVIAIIVGKMLIFKCPA